LVCFAVQNQSPYSDLQLPKQPALHYYYLHCN